MQCHGLCPIKNSHDNTGNNTGEKVHCKKENKHQRAWCNRLHHGGRRRKGKFIVREIAVRYIGARPHGPRPTYRTMTRPGHIYGDEDTAPRTPAPIPAEVVLYHIGWHAAPCRYRLHLIPHPVAGKRPGLHRDPSGYSKPRPPANKHRYTV